MILIKNVYVFEQLKYINVFYYNICNLHKHNQIQIDFIFSQKIIVNELIKLLFKQIFKQFIKFIKLIIND